MAISPKSSAHDLARPGHVFTLRARKGGVLVRAGQTEASVDLARLAGLTPAGVICEVMNEDGTMARVADLLAFCNAHRLKMVTVADLIRSRMQHERYVYRVGEAMLPTRHGELRMIAYESEISGGESHVTLVRGELSSAEQARPILVRVHTHCFAGDGFGSALCGCRVLIDGSLAAINHEDLGTLIYLHNTQPGFGVDRRRDAGHLILHGSSQTKERNSDSQRREQRTLREVGLGGQILSDLGISRIRLLTNRPTHVPALQEFGIEIVEHVRVKPVPRHVRASF